MAAVVADWDVIKAKHCKGINLRVLAEEYGIKYGTLRVRAAREQWSQTVTAARNAVTQSVTEKLTGIAERHVLKIAGISDIAIDKVAEKLAKDPSIDALAKLATVAETFDRITRRTCGLDKVDTGTAKPISLAVNLHVAGSATGVGHCLGNVIDVDSEIVEQQGKLPATG